MSKQAERGSLPKPAKPQHDDADLRAPIPEEHLAAARGIVNSYVLVIAPAPEEDGGGFIGYARELRTVVGYGETQVACVTSTVGLLVETVADLRRRGKGFPEPGSGKRDQQVNVKLTEHEGEVIDGAVSGLGFQGKSDFMRVAALEKAQGVVPAHVLGCARD